MKKESVPTSLISELADQPPSIHDSFCSLRLAAPPPLLTTGDPVRDLAAIAQFNLLRMNSLSEAVEAKLEVCDDPKLLVSLIMHLMNIRAKTARLAAEAVGDVAGALGRKSKRTVEAD